MVTNSVFSGSDNGVRIKSWARPSNGFVRKVVYKNLIMKNVQNPIIIDQNYCPGNKGCPRQVISCYNILNKLIIVI
jgi:polygalacturonase